MHEIDIAANRNNSQRLPSLARRTGASKHGCANCGSTDFIVATDLSGRPFPGQLCDKCNPMPSWLKGPPTMPGRWFVYAYGWYLVERDADGTILDSFDDESVIHENDIRRSYGPIPTKYESKQ